MGIVTSGCGGSDGSGIGGGGGGALRSPNICTALSNAAMVKGKVAHSSPTGFKPTLTILGGARQTSKQQSSSTRPQVPLAATSLSLHHGQHSSVAVGAMGDNAGGGMAR